MFKVNNKDTRKIPVASFWTYFTPCSSVSTVNFEHVLASWLMQFLWLMSDTAFGHWIRLNTSFKILSNGRTCCLIIIKKRYFHSVLFYFYYGFKNWSFLRLKCCDLSLLQCTFVISKSERTIMSCRNGVVL